MISTRTVAQRDAIAALQRMRSKLRDGRTIALTGVEMIQLYADFHSISFPAPEYGHDRLVGMWFTTQSLAWNDHGGPWGFHAGCRDKTFKIFSTAPATPIAP